MQAHQLVYRDGIAVGEEYRRQHGRVLRKKTVRSEVQQRVIRHPYSNRLFGGLATQQGYTLRLEPLGDESRLSLGRRERPLGHRSASGGRLIGNVRRVANGQ